MKPTVRATPAGFLLTRPGYGFKRPETLGPFKSIAEASNFLIPETASAGQFVSAPASTYFGRYQRHLYQPLEIR